MVMHDFINHSWEGLLGEEAQPWRPGMWLTHAIVLLKMKQKIYVKDMAGIWIDEITPR